MKGIKSTGMLWSRRLREQLRKPVQIILGICTTGTYKMV